MFAESRFRNGWKVYPDPKPKFNDFFKNETQASNSNSNFYSFGVALSFVFETVRLFEFELSAAVR